MLTNLTVPISRLSREHGSSDYYEVIHEVITDRSLGLYYGWLHRFGGMAQKAEKMLPKIKRNGCTQNRRQNIFNRGALRLLKGA